MGFNRLHEAFGEDHSFMLTEVDIGFDALGEYLNLTSHTVREKLHEAKRRGELILANGNELDAEMFDDLEHMITAATLKMHYEGLFLAMYSHFELSFRRLCRIAENHSRSKVKLAHIAGDGISKYRTYLETVCGIDFSLANEEWADITKYKELRNQIAHHGGLVKTDNKAVNRLKSIPHITYKADGEDTQFEVSNVDLLVQARGRMRAFFKKVVYQKL